MSMEAIRDLRAKLEFYAGVTERAGVPFEGLGLTELGDLHRFLRLALADIEDALAPRIVQGSARGMTYAELAVAAGYGSLTTITKIMREAGASPGRGSNQPLQRRRRVA